MRKLGNGQVSVTAMMTSFVHQLNLHCPNDVTTSYEQSVCGNGEQTDLMPDGHFGGFIMTIGAFLC